MLTVEEEHRILEAAAPHLRVAIVLLVQTGGRTYSEGLSLRWDQVDLVQDVVHPGSSVKTPDSAQLLPLSQLARDILKEWKKEQGSESPFVFPSPQSPGKPIRSVKRAWRAALKKAGVPYFPIYNPNVRTNEPIRGNRNYYFYYVSPATEKETADTQK